MTSKSAQESSIMLDIPVRVSLEVGRATIAIRDFLKLSPGSIVELERPAGSPLDVYVNDRLVAHGEVVMVNDRYGVRFTDAICASDVRR
jgi:flagellar motor switch protein FliN